MENKNLYRLAELGLKCIADSHEINRNISLIYDEAKRNKNEVILKCLQNIELSLSSLSRIKYQKEVEDKKDISLLEISNKVANYFNGSYWRVSVNCKSDATVNTSNVALLQSLINLVDNALGFSNEDDDKKKNCLITVDGKSITVSDNGNGVPNEIKEQIFEMYFTTKDVSRQGSSTSGLGLYAVKQHIDNIGAKISVENNTILSGANFKITF